MTFERAAYLFLQFTCEHVQNVHTRVS